jgi:hypothetical protein
MSETSGLTDIDTDMPIGAELFEVDRQLAEDLLCTPRAVRTGTPLLRRLRREKGKGRGDGPLPVILTGDEGGESECSMEDVDQSDARSPTPGARPVRATERRPTASRKRWSGGPIRGVGRPDGEVDELKNMIGGLVEELAEVKRALRRKSDAEDLKAAREEKEKEDDTAKWVGFFGEWVRMREGWARMEAKIDEGTGKIAALEAELRAALDDGEKGLLKGAEQAAGHRKRRMEEEMRKMSEEERETDRMLHKRREELRKKEEELLRIVNAPAGEAARVAGQVGGQGPAAPPTQTQRPAKRNERAPAPPVPVTTRPRRGGPGEAAASQDRRQPTYAQATASQVHLAGGWTEVPMRGRGRRNAQGTAGAEGPAGPDKPEKNLPMDRRRVVIRREQGARDPKGGPMDFISTVNRGLAANGAPHYVRLHSVSKNQRGTVTAVTREGCSAEVLMRYADTVIKHARMFDPTIIGLDTNENWPRLKVHGLPLERYVGKGTFGLGKLREEIEADNEGVKVPIEARWLGRLEDIKKRWIEKRTFASTAVIAVKGEAVAAGLVRHGVWVCGRRLEVTPFEEIRPDTQCGTCCGFGHISEQCPNMMKPRCMICAGGHTVRNHACSVIGCSRRGGDACAHVVVKCANCGGAHPARSVECKARGQAIGLAREQLRQRGEWVARRKREEEKKEEDKPAEDPEGDMEVEQSEEEEDQGDQEMLGTAPEGQARPASPEF